MTPEATVELKKAARGIVKRAIAKGLLVRPKRCQKCRRIPKLGSDGRATIHAHHHLGYGSPMMVQWLCPKCHFIEDPRPAGENNGRAKMTNRKAAEIRRLYRPNATWQTPTGSLHELSRQFGICIRTVGRIVQNETWRCALPPEAAKA